MWRCGDHLPTSATSGYERHKSHWWTNSGRQAAIGGLDMPLMPLMDHRWSTTVKQCRGEWRKWATKHENLIFSLYLGLITMKCGPSHIPMRPPYTHVECKFSNNTNSIKIHYNFLWGEVGQICEKWATHRVEVGHHEENWATMNTMTTDAFQTYR